MEIIKDYTNHNFLNQTESKAQSNENKQVEFNKPSKACCEWYFGL